MSQVVNGLGRNDVGPGWAEKFWPMQSSSPHSVEKVTIVYQILVIVFTSYCFLDDRTFLIKK